MRGIRAAISRVLRGSRVGRFLEVFGIDPRRFWLLVDLFDQLSERGEMLDQLGRNGIALRYVTGAYCVVSGFLSLALLVRPRSPEAYCSAVFLFTGFFLLSVLLIETGNSLVNPVEGLVLAHQPINGATYTAAKLTHLARILLYLVPGLNGIPAFAGLLLKGARWWYPLFHLALAFTMGFMFALLSCALFGWLLRLLPPQRARAAAQLAGVAPLLGLNWMSYLRRWLTPSVIWLPAYRPVRWVLSLAAVAAAATIVTLGLRSLSGDFLVRVSGMLRGGRAAGARARKSRLAGVVARLCGGQSARAGFAFVSKMMLRDWQFRRQAAPLAVLVLIPLAGAIARGWRTDPFSGRFTTIHFVPHVFGVVLFFVCVFLAYGNDYKGAWIFLVAPSEAFGPFARGVHALLWIRAIAIPHLILSPLLAWSWGAWHAALFLAYSLAATSLYLALELLLIEGVPFSKQMDPTRGQMMLPLMIIAGLIMALAVALQYFLVFRSPAITASVTVIAGAGAYLATRRCLNDFEDSIRLHLGLLSVESGTLYKEVAV